MNGVMSVMIAVFVVLGSTHALAETTATLKDLNGTEFEVSFAELSAKYFTSHAVNGVNQQITNGDGTIAIVNPVFDYAGKQIPFGTTEKGICGYFNFSRSHGYEWTRKGGPVVYARMQDDGQLYKIDSAGRRSTAAITTAVVCSNRTD